MKYDWTCACCGLRFDSLPLDYALSGPDHWHAMSAEEKEHRTRKDADVCIIDDTDIYLRGCLEIPVVDLDEKFVWGVWVSLSRKSFDRVIELWDKTIRSDEPSLIGWLSNNIALYPNTLNLKADVHLRNDGQRPSIILEPTDHPLAIEQRRGITRQRVEEIAAILHRRRQRSQ